MDKESKQKKGRPLKFKTVEELEDKIQEYFETQCKTVGILDENGLPLVTSKGFPVVDYNPPTVAGLALYLGFCDRQSMYDYKERPVFSCTIKKAISRIEDYAEKQLTQGNSTGAIFWLKNHGWKDKSETELTGANGAPIAVQTSIDLEKVKELKELLNE